MIMFLEILGWIGSLVFVVVFIGLCIFVHELGHFLAARWRGLHIDAFSLGFRKIWCKKINGIEYRIGCLPFGGYVELPQVDTTEAIPKSADGVELPPAKPLDRIITAAAGPLFNVLFGLFLACFVWIFGMPMPPDAAKLTEFNVLSVDETSPEYQAGLRPGDTITAFDNEPFEMSWAEFTQAIMLKPGLAVQLDVRRPGTDGVIDIDEPYCFTVGCIETDVAVTRELQSLVLYDQCGLVEILQDLPGHLHGLIVTAVIDDKDELIVRIGLSLEEAYAILQKRSTVAYRHYH